MPLDLAIAPPTAPMSPPIDALAAPQSPGLYPQPAGESPGPAKTNVVAMLRGMAWPFSCERRDARSELHDSGGFVSAQHQRAVKQLCFRLASRLAQHRY